MKASFPHILSTPLQLQSGFFRIVSDKEIGDTLTNFNRRQLNPATDQMEQVFNIYRIDEIREKRKARGDWTNWDKHPDYYLASGKYLGDQFSSNLGTDVFIK